MSDNENLESEAKLWLTEIFRKENILDFSVEIKGKPKKGENYIGDVLFAKVSATCQDLQKDFDLVLKCSKRSEVAKNDDRFKAPFVNEIYFYGTLMPILQEFQTEKKIQKPFNFVPKYYGAYTDETQLILVLENMQKNGFNLWPRQQPLTKKHIDLVLEAYGKLHATSVALHEEQPENFQKIADTLEGNLEKFDDSASANKMFKNSILETYNVLRNELDENILEKWKNLREQVSSIFENLQNADLKVILHGDCWNNNFMFKYKSESNNPSEVVIIDWQMPRVGTPISDLSYFLFVCISEDDIKNLDNFVADYYKYFCDHLTSFGVGDPKIIYPKTKFLEDWKKHCKIGIILASLLTKICSVEEADVVDLDAEGNNNNFLEGFSNEITGKGKEIFKNRMRYIVNYVGKNNLI